MQDESIGKLGTDIAPMSVEGLEDAAPSGGGKSSAMAPKSNQINAEVLTMIARWNATLLGGFYQAQLHKYERSGSVWTMEWLAMPQMV